MGGRDGREVREVDHWFCRCMLSSSPETIAVWYPV